MAKKIKITLVNSVIGRPERQKRTVKSLGLGKLSSVAIHNPTDDILGKVKAIAHLIKVEEIEG